MMLTVFFIVLGCFLDGISMVVLTIAVLLHHGRGRGLLTRSGWHLHRAGGGDGADHAARGLNLFVIQAHQARHRLDRLRGRAHVLRHAGRRDHALCLAADRAWLPSP